MDNVFQSTQSTKLISITYDLHVFSLIDKENWKEMSSEFQKSGIKDLKLIAEEIDKNITDNSKSADKYQKLLSNWGKNETIEKIIKNFKKYSKID